MTDERGDEEPRRPRPQFGELATPEEQRAAIAVPSALTSSEPVPVEADRVADAPRSTPAPLVSPDARRSPADRFISWALLGVGLFHILSSTSALFDLPTVIDDFFRSADLDPYGPVAAGRTLGIVALVVYVVLWIAALLLVQRRIGRGRSSWWIPLVAGVVANLVVIALVGSAMMIDPSIAGYIEEMSRTGRTLP